MPGSNSLNTVKRFPKGFGAVQVRSETVSEEDRTVEVIWSTGAAVKRWSWEEGPYIEELEISDDAIRMDRFAGGMSLLDSHNGYSMDSRLGTVVPGSVRIEGGKAYALVKFSRSEAGDRVFQDLIDGHPVQISVGYVVHAYTKSEGSGDNLPIYRATDWEPMELSAVPIPADPGAHSRSEQSEETFECAVVEQRDPQAVSPANTLEKPMNKRDAANSFEGDQLTALALGANIVRKEGEDDNALRARLLEAYDAEERSVEETGAGDDADESQQRSDTSITTRSNSAPQNPAPLTPESRGVSEEDTRRIAQDAVRADRARANEIIALARTARIDESSDVVRTAIDQGHSTQQFRDAVLDHLVGQQEGSRTFPVVDTRGMQDATDTRRAAIQNAILHRYDPSNNQLTDAGRQYRAMSLIEMARHSLMDAGENVRGLAPAEIAARAMHSTSDFPVILSNVTNATLRAAYEAYPQTFRAFCRQTTAPNFKEIRRLQLGEAPGLLKVNEHGEYKRGTLEEGKEAYTIATYGRVVAITRQTLINDDLDAFTRLPGMFGTAVAALESDVVYSILVNNQKMSDGKGLFHNDHKNIATAAALSGEAMGKGRALMNAQRGMDNKTKLNLRPAFLLVPSELEYTAEKIMSGAFTPTTESNVVPQSIRTMQTIAEPRLSDISATNWHLVASPTTIDTIEYAYLEGNEGPYVETREGFDVDGMELKIRLDFGAAPIDWRGFVRNAGQ